MRKRRKALVVRPIWVAAGVAIGATIALPWAQGLTPDWIEATGTWFGAVATVLALLWAVQTFRADQAHGEEERRRVDADRAAALDAEARRIRTDADRVAPRSLDATRAASSEPSSPSTTPENSAKPCATPRGGPAATPTR